MASWSTRRKSVYASISIAIAAIAVAVPSYLFFYKAPTCFDGVKNGDEQGIDCGGSCTKLCSSSFVPIPPASWVRFEKIAPHLYNVAAYLVNPNPNAAALDLPYEFQFLDADGVTIGKADGTVSLAPGRNALAFQSDVSTGVQTPVRAIMVATGAPTWKLQSDLLSELVMTDKKYAESADGSSLEVTFSNEGTTPISNVTVYAILRDADGNVVDFSKTAIDGIAPQATAIAPFTWPASHDGKVISIEVLPVAE